MTTLERTRLLIIDDWGPEPLNAEQRRDLLEILDDRYDRGSLLVTSQIPTNKLPKRSKGQLRSARRRSRQKTKPASCEAKPPGVRSGGSPIPLGDDLRGDAGQLARRADTRPSCPRP